MTSRRQTIRHPSVPPAHPGALVAEALEDMKLSKVDAARQLGVTRAALYHVLDETSAISAAMAVRIERVMNISADLLVRMQANHDLWHARQALSEAG